MTWGVTGGYAIPHFRNFSALFPQIRIQKLAISAILSGYEHSLPTSYKTQHKPFSFHFAHDRSDSSSLQSSWVVISREDFVVAVAIVAVVFRSL